MPFSFAARLVYQGILDHCSHYAISCTEIRDAVQFGPRVRKPSKVDYAAMQPNFCYLPVDTIRATFEHTSQNMSFPPSSHLQKYHRSRNPAANVHCRNEDDAMDQVFSDTPAVDGGETSAYFFVGTKSHLTSVHKTKRENEDAALASFQDRVRKYGRPKRLLADNAGVYRGNRFTQYLRDLWISLWQSEAHK